MRPLLISSGVWAIVGLSCAGSVSAQSPSECRALAGNAMALRECLQNELDANYLAMNEALAGAGAVAKRTDRLTGGDVAIFAVEASQHAWEAYRDTACQARGVFVDGGGERAAIEVACAIELTRSRTEELLGLASPGSD